MIAWMNNHWLATIERLAELDRSQAFADLAVMFKALPSQVPEEQSAAVAHWRGKVAFVNDVIAEAISQLAFAASLNEQRAVNH